MFAKRAVSLLRCCINQRKSHTKHEYTEEFSCQLTAKTLREFINGLTVILKPRKVFGLFRAS